MADPRHLTSRTDGGALVVTLTTPTIFGDTLASELTQELTAATETSGAGRVVIDFQQVKEISSPGMRALINFRREFLKKGGRIALCGLSPHVRGTLGLVRLVDTGGWAPAVGLADGSGARATPPLFEVVEPDVASAVARLGSGGPD
jgi:anti-anti-sigma factor